MIGPELYDSYVLVLKVVLIVISASIGVGFLIHTILNPISILDYFIDMIVSSVTALPMAFGWTTFGFAMGEFFGEINENDLPGQVWKPSEKNKRIGNVNLGKLRLMLNSELIAG